MTDRLPIDDDLLALFGGDVDAVATLTRQVTERERVEVEQETVDAELVEESASAMEAANAPQDDPGRTRTDLDTAHLGSVSGGVGPATLFDAVGEYLVQTGFDAAERTTATGVAVDGSVLMDALAGEIGAQEDAGSNLFAATLATASALARHSDELIVTEQTTGLGGFLENAAVFASGREPDVTVSATDGRLTNEDRLLEQVGQAQPALEDYIQVQLDAPTGEGAQLLRNELNQLLVDGQAIRGQAFMSGQVSPDLLRDFAEKEVALGRETDWGAGGIGVAPEESLKAHLNALDGASASVSGDQLPGDMPSLMAAINSAEGLPTDLSAGKFEDEMGVALEGLSLHDWYVSEGRDATLDADAGAEVRWGNHDVERVLDAHDQPDLWPGQLSDFAREGRDATAVAATISALNDGVEKDYLVSAVPHAFQGYPGMNFYSVAHEVDGGYTPALIGLDGALGQPAMLLDVYRGGEGMPFEAAMAVQALMNEKLLADPQLGLDAVGELSRGLGQVPPDSVRDFSVAYAAAQEIPAWTLSANEGLDRMATMESIGAQAGMDRTQIARIEAEVGLIEPLEKNRMMNSAELDDAFDMEDELAFEPEME